MSMTRQQVGELRERAHARPRFAANREKVDPKRAARADVSFNYRFVKRKRMRAGNIVACEERVSSRSRANIPGRFQRADNGRRTIDRPGRSLRARGHVILSLPVDVPPSLATAPRWTFPGAITAISFIAETRRPCCRSSFPANR